LQKYIEKKLDLVYLALVKGLFIIYIVAKFVRAKVGRTQVLPLSTDNSICPMKRCSAADDPDLSANFFKRNNINENH
jgi:hypothetical protein